MFYDLHTPFPSASSHATSSASSSSAAKQPSKKQLKKAAAGGPPGGDDWRKKQAEEDERKKGRDCWFGVPSEEREKCEGGVRMARHCESRCLTPLDAGGEFSESSKGTKRRRPSSSLLPTLLFASSGSRLLCSRLHPDSPLSDRSSHALQPFQQFVPRAVPELRSEVRSSGSCRTRRERARSAFETASHTR